MPIREGIYGLLAEFDTPTELVVAAKTAYDEGWRRMDCYTPYPVEEAAVAAKAASPPQTAVPLVAAVANVPLPASDGKITIDVRRPVRVMIKMTNLLDVTEILKALQSKGFKA